MGAAIFLRDCKVTSERLGGGGGFGGVMGIRSKSPPLVKALSRPRHPTTIAHYRPSPSSPPRLLAPYLSSETLHLLVFASSPHTSTFSPSPLYSHPSPVGCHGCHFPAPTHLLQGAEGEAAGDTGAFKKDNVPPNPNTHTHTNKPVC